MQHTASFRFYLSLNDFLRSSEKGEAINYLFRGDPAVKDAIEAIGVPHPEVDVILINNEPVTFMQPLKDADIVKVYPVSPELSWPSGYSLSEDIDKPFRFVLDVHLGTLAKTLRMLGFDTYYERDLADQEIARIAQEEERIVLTRDVGLLKQKIIERGYWLRSQQTEEQLQEVIVRFGILDALDPLTRCLLCNAEIEQVKKESVMHHLPPKTREYFNEFYQCPACTKVYWKGSHYERMQEFVRKVKQNRSDGS